MKVCPKCGLEYRGSIPKFCMECGTCLDGFEMSENRDRVNRILRYIYSASAKLSDKKHKAIKELLDKYPLTLTNLLVEALEIEK